MESVRSKQVQCEEGVRPFSPLHNKKNRVVSYTQALVSSSRYEQF